MNEGEKITKRKDMTGTIGIFQKQNYIDREELEVLVTSHTDQKVTLTSVDFFEKAFTDLSKRTEYIKWVAEKLTIIPGLGAVGSGAILITGATINDVVLMIFGGFGGLLLSFGGAIGLVTRPDHTSEVFFAAIGELKLFDQWFQYFKQNPEDYKVSTLLKSFEQLNGKWLVIAEKDELLIKDHLQLFKSTGKLLLMEAICIMLKQNNEDSKLAIKWEKVKELNTTSDYDNFWRELGVASPSAEGYLEVNTQRGFLDLDQFNAILKQRFAEAVQRGLDTGVL